MRSTVPALLLLGAAMVVSTSGASAAQTSQTLPAQTSPAGKPEVVVIGTGGTIAGVSESRVDFQTYRSGELPIDKLIADLRPEVDKLADINAVDFGTKDSAAYTIGDYYDLSRAVDKHLRTADAVVVSTGTTTMEELGYWLDLTVRSSKPVVLTGALRPWTVIGSDGPPNLYNAIAVAASQRTRCFGSVFVLNDQILSAREATKTNTLRLDSFDAPELGVLGVVDETRIRVKRAPRRARLCAQPGKWRTPFDLSSIDRSTLPRVEIAYTYAAAGGAAIEAFADAGAQGIVFAGSPSPEQTAAALEVAKTGVVLAAATRNNAGAVYPPTPHVLAAGDLLPHKTRLLLILALARTHDLDQLRDWFATYGDR